MIMKVSTKRVDRLANIERLLRSIDRRLARMVPEEIEVASPEIKHYSYANPPIALAEGGLDDV